MLLIYIGDNSVDKPNYQTKVHQQLVINKLASDFEEILGDSDQIVLTDALSGIDLDVLFADWTTDPLQLLSDVT